MKPSLLGIRDPRTRRPSTTHGGGASVHIGRVVVEGFSGVAAADLRRAVTDKIVAALTREPGLAQLAAAGGVERSDVTHRLKASASSAQIGDAIAKAVTGPVGPAVRGRRGDATNQNVWSSGGKER